LKKAFAFVTQSTSDTGETEIRSFLKNREARVQKAGTKQLAQISDSASMLSDGVERYSSHVRTLLQ